MSHIFKTQGIILINLIKYCTKYCNDILSHTRRVPGLEGRRKLFPFQQVS